MKKVCKGAECRFYDDTRYYDLYNGKQNAYCRYTKEFLEVDCMNKVVLSNNKKCISDNILEESIEEKKTLSEKVTLTTGKTYDIEVICGNYDLELTSLSTMKDIIRAPIKRYENVTLIKITNQAHFITEDEQYLLLPWCYIVSMIPSRERE